MTLTFPSREFDDAVAAVCHGQASDEQASALVALLRSDLQARDAYLHQVALHAHLASTPDLFAGSAPEPIPMTPASDWTESSTAAATGHAPAPSRWSGWTRNLALAAGIAILLAAAWWAGSSSLRNRRGETSRAVAMLNRTVHARWDRQEQIPKLGGPLEPGLLRLESGLAQIVFYNGARVAIEGPAELRLVSSTEAVCTRGTLTAEVPPQARGFRIVSPRLDVTDLGTSFGLRVEGQRSELHVFQGEVEIRTGAGTAQQSLLEGKAAVVDGTAAPRWMSADRSEFAGLFDLQAQSLAAEAQRYDRWRASIRELQRDPSLWVHLDFEHGGTPAWRLPNAGSKRDTIPDAAIVGCEWTDGRWTTKPALEFRGVSDRVRLNVPGELESVTLAAWVRVQGLDRRINSLFMSDGFLPGTLHWVIRNDGVLGLTVIGDRGNHQILASPPVLSVDEFGIWTHLAVVLDGKANTVVHYVNGRPVSRHGLRLPPPFRIDAAELGNWTAGGAPGNDPFLIRNFSGVIDEFCLFSRALSPAELSALHAQGRPQQEPGVAWMPPNRSSDRQSISTSLTPTP